MDILTTMTTDLKMLTFCVILLWLQILPYFLPAIKEWKIIGLVGNREDLPPLPDWAQRAKRAEINMITNITHFAILVLVAHVAGVANETTAMGATIFFFARVAYAVIYTAGIPWLRTFAWVAGLAGELMILSQIL